MKNFSPLINLRPWREEKRLAQQQRFKYLLLLGLGLGLAISWVKVASLSALLNQLDANNQLMAQQLAAEQQQLAELAPLKAARQAAYERLTLLTQVQPQLSLNFLAFSQLVTSMNDKVLITQVVRQANQLNILGEANDSLGVTQLLLSLAQQPNFHEPLLTSLDYNPAKGLINFNLRLTLQEQQL
mgnify:CR=1 FL=1